MHPVQEENGTWSVEDSAGYVLASGLTNDQAWRFCDEAHGEHVNSQESVHAWSLKMQASKQ